MYAIVETGGMQFKVSPNHIVRVPKIEVEEGQKIDLEKVLLLQDGQKTYIGSPNVAGAKVIAEVLSHGKDDKIVVFKMKKRKNYRRKRGHRQNYTELLIKKVVGPRKKKED
jgi:large subunit ribosomal protein L21